MWFPCWVCLWDFWRVNPLCLRVRQKDHIIRLFFGDVEGKEISLIEYPICCFRPYIAKRWRSRWVVGDRDLVGIGDLNGKECRHLLWRMLTERLLLSRRRRCAIESSYLAGIYEYCGKSTFSDWEMQLKSGSSRRDRLWYLSHLHGANFLGRRADFSSVQSSWELESEGLTKIEWAVMELEYLHLQRLRAA